MRVLASKAMKRTLAKDDLTRHLLALVLTALLVWHTVVIPPTAYAPAKRSPRRRSRGHREREAESLRSGAAPLSSVESVDEMDWPEFIGLE